VMSISNPTASFDTFNDEVNRFGRFLSDMNVQAEGYQVSALLLASQCQDFSIGLLSLKDSLVLSSRLTLLRGLYEASMRLNYVAIKGESGALDLEFTDLSARVEKFKLANKICPELQCSQIHAEEIRLEDLRCDKRLTVKFSVLLDKITEEKDSIDYWLYRYWSGFAHSELFELSRQAVKSGSKVASVTALTCSPSQLSEIYQYATCMLVRAGNCLVSIFGGDAHASK